MIAAKLFLLPLLILPWYYTSFSRHCQPRKRFFKKIRTNIRFALDKSTILWYNKNRRLELIFLRAKLSREMKGKFKFGIRNFEFGIEDRLLRKLLLN